MTVIEFCRVGNCWLKVGHHGDHTPANAKTPLVCVCHTPIPTPSDQCNRCFRVIAELVYRRRAMRAAVDAARHEEAS